MAPHLSKLDGATVAEDALGAKDDYRRRIS